MSWFVDKLKNGSLGVLKNYALIPLIGIGILCYFVSMISFIEEISILSQAISTAGTTIISSSVFLTIVKSRQFSDIFADQLKDIVYCGEYLQKRKDIRDIWLKTSKALYQHNFPELCDQVESNIEKYIPNDSSKYYKDYVYKVDISFLEGNSEFIKLDERETFDLFTRSTEKTDYNSSCVFNRKDYEDEISSYKLNLFKVNNKESMPSSAQLKVNNRYNGNKIGIIHKRVLKDAKKYSIEKEEVKIYSLLVENTKSHTCDHIFYNYTLEVTHPKELEVKFYENGTLNNFEIKPKRKIGSSVVQRFEYKGLMFKNHGTRLIFRDKR